VSKIKVNFSWYSQLLDKLLFLNIYPYKNHCNNYFISFFHWSKVRLRPLSTLAPFTKIVGFKPTFLFPTECLKSYRALPSYFEVCISWGTIKSLLTPERVYSCSAKACMNWLIVFVYNIVLSQAGMLSKKNLKHFKAISAPF